MVEQPWFRSDPEALRRTVADAMGVQPRLRVVDEGERVFLRGRFDIRNGGDILESFAVEIQLPIQSPQHPPIVREIDGRIPRVTDPHHVNDADGTLCVVLEEAYWYDHPCGLSLVEFMEGPLRTHLAGQVEVLRGSQWPAGEWRHGADGRMQFYSEVLETSDREILRRLLLAACSPLTKTYLPCPCGSGRKLRKCHGPRLHKLSQAPSFEWVREVLDNDVSLESLVGTP